jgi:hypothetical protein
MRLLGFRLLKGSLCNEEGCGFQICETSACFLFRSRQTSKSFTTFSAFVDVDSSVPVLKSHIGLYPELLGGIRKSGFENLDCQEYCNAGPPEDSLASASRRGRVSNALGLVDSRV